MVNEATGSWAERSTTKCSKCRVGIREINGDCGGDVNCRSPLAPLRAGSRCAGDEN